MIIIRLIGKYALTNNEKGRPMNRAMLKLIVINFYTLSVKKNGVSKKKPDQHRV